MARRHYRAGRGQAFRGDQTACFCAEPGRRDKPRLRPQLRRFQRHRGPASSRRPLRATRRSCPGGGLHHRQRQYRRTAPPPASLEGPERTLPPTPEDVIEDAASSALAEVVLEPGTISTDTRKIDMVITKPELIN